MSMVSICTMASSGTNTRSRILEAAWALVRDLGANGVTIARIAAAAGVSRQLVYFHFENRAGLLEAMARHHEVQSGFRERVAATRSRTPEEGLEELLREWCDYVPEILPVARALEAAQVTGDDGATAWQDRTEDLWEALHIAVERVDREGRLASGWTVETATDWIWARSHLTVWQHLVDERGWALDEYRERSTRSILDEILTYRPSAGASADEHMT